MGKCSESRVEKKTQESKCNEAWYQTRIIAFADILGWKAATRISSGKEDEFKRLHKAVTGIEKHAHSFTSQIKETMKNQMPGSFNNEQYEAIEFSFFSDSFAISALEPHGKSVFTIISWAIDKLLGAGFLVRGGIALGKLYHRERMIFGPALVEAVEIEQKMAIYPRVLCSNELLKYLYEKQYREEVVLQDCCGEWVIKIAPGTEHRCNDLMKVIEGKLRETIEKESSDSAKIASKWRYMQIMLPRMYAA